MVTFTFTLGVGLIWVVFLTAGGLGYVSCNFCDLLKQFKVPLLDKNTASSLIIVILSLGLFNSNDTSKITVHESFYRKLI